jgi:hypothetical protein
MSATHFRDFLGPFPVIRHIVRTCPAGYSTVQDTYMDYRWWANCECEVVSRLRPTYVL